MTEPEIIAFLWGIIDDIDTQSDVCKGDLKAYEKRVERLHALRWQTGITTDGYSLVMPDGTMLPERKSFRF